MSSSDVSFSRLIRSPTNGLPNVWKLNEKVGVATAAPELADASLPSAE